MSHKIIDSGTAFHFGVGAFAGWFGMDPKAVLLTALLADATWEVIKAGSVGAALEPAHGQSKAQEIMNLLAIMAGAHGGMYAREKWKPEAAAQPAAAPPATVAGLGCPPGMQLTRCGRDSRCVQF